MISKILRHILFALIFLTGSLVASAQGLPGYVVKLSGDTLRGTLTELPDLNKVRLIETTNSTQKEYSPSEIKGYGLYNYTMIRSALTKLASGQTRQSFVRSFVVGTASLFTYPNEEGLFLSTVTIPDTLYELTAINWHLLFNRHLSGCSSLDQSSYRVMTLPFRSTSVQRVVSEYNRCVQPGWRNVSASNSSVWRSGYGLRTQVSKIMGSSTADEGTVTSAGLEWTGVRTTGFFLNFGVQYRLFNAKSVYYTVAPSVLERVIVRTHVVSPYAALGKRWGKHNRPNFYAGAGIEFDAPINIDERFEYRTFSGTATGSSVNDITLMRSGIGFQIKTGTILPVGSSSEIRVSAIYHRHPSFAKHLVGLEASYTIFRK